MKRVNINRDVESRRTIATSPTAQTEKPIVEPVKQEETNAQSEDSQGSEDDKEHAQPLPTTQKKGRKTQGEL